MSTFIRPLRKAMSVPDPYGRVHDSEIRVSFMFPGIDNKELGSL